MNLRGVGSGKSLARFAEAVDFAWSGAWWWQGLLFFELRSLDRVLESEGEDSFVTLQGTEKVRDMALAVTYLRPVGPALRQALEQAAERGVSLQDLRILNLNLDIVARSDQPAFVRNAFWMPVLAWMAASLTVLGQILLTVQVVAARGSWPAKTLAMVCIAAVMILIWQGFSLYTTRAWSVVKRCGPRIDALRLVCATASVREFPASRQRRT